MRGILLAGAAVAALTLAGAGGAAEPVAEVGVRPAFLIDQMPDGPLKDKLASCEAGPFHRSDFSISHRGAPLQFPEHTVSSLKAGIRQGAGILECDVTFTSDKQLVCRHAQDDLATTTNILATPLAANCTKPFAPASGDTPASAECRTSDVTLAEFETLRGKMDAGDKKATTVEAFMDSTPSFRTDLYSAESGELMTLDDYIAIVKAAGGKFTPELKAAVVPMPYDGMTQEQYAQKMIDAFKAAGVAPEDVYAQSFNLDDILYWVKNEPEFAKNAVYLDGSDETVEGFDPMKPETWAHSMADLKAMGVNIIAPPMWMLLTLADGRIVPSEYAKEAKDAGLRIITWSLERSGPLTAGGGYYYQSITPAVTSDAVMYEVVDVLAQQVGVIGIFSDWPATVTYYANCMGEVM